MFKIIDNDFDEKHTQGESQEGKDIFLGFCAILGVIALVTLVKEKAWDEIIFIASVIGLITFFVQRYKHKRTQENQEVEQTKHSFVITLQNKNMLPLPSLLNSEEALASFIEEEKLNIDLVTARTLLSKKIERVEQELIFKLTSECGGVELKQILLENCDIDLGVIDKAFENLEEVLPIRVNDLLEEINSQDYETKSAQKEEIECGRINLNLFYSVQNEEIKQLLSTGCRNISTIDFEKEETRIGNLKYYASDSIDLPFNLSEFKQRYESFDKIAFDFYNARVLKNSVYPSFVKKDFELCYKEVAKTLIVDYSLPNIDDIPLIKQINKQLNEIGFKEKELNNIYENILYQITLRTIYELCYNDKINAIEGVVFNGWANYIDKADGNAKTSCILSMEANKEDFMSVQLQNVEAKACFKKFKGISCSDLSTITPVRPILTINKLDKRFIESYEVMAKLSEGDNLAMMDWQDFENLVREILEKELAEKGCEVKITQSSRDGGVDAIAYNPDPLLGGKICVQAKRYINTVGVSAVRDLYGTMQHENAIRGILVTTSHFGADSYDFVKDKPITLIEGSNLLHMLENHGHKARIDINEARLLKDS